MTRSRRRYQRNATNAEFVARWRGIDPQHGQLVFEVGCDPKRPATWLLWRESIGCFETGRFTSATEAKAWGTKLTERRPVRWDKALTWAPGSHIDVPSCGRAAALRIIQQQQEQE